MARCRPASHLAVEPRTVLWAVTIRRLLSDRAIWWPAFAVFAVLRVAATFGVPPERFGDTASYERGVSFIGPGRLWVVPLLYRLGSDARVVAQVLIGVVCWSVLAAITARMLRDVTLRRVATVLVLLVGLSTQVTQWDHVLLSESPAMSFTALLIAAGLTYTTSPDRRSLAFLAAAVVLWTFTRPTHVLLLLVLAAAVGVSLVVKHGRRSRATVLVVLVLVSAWGAISLRGNTQFEYNSLGIVSTRILNDEAALEFFADRGMPTSHAIRREAGRFVGQRSPLFRNDELTEWVRSEWQALYAEYLLRHPGDTVREPLGDALELLSADPQYGKPRRVLPPMIANLLFKVDKADLALLWLLVGGLILVAVRYRPPVHAATSLAVASAAGVMYMMTWHMSVTELQRLEVIPSVALRLGLLLTSVFVIDGHHQATAPTRQPAVIE